MKKFLFVILCLGATLKISGQSLDFGIGVGGAVYWGDLNTPDFGTNVGNTNLAVQAVANLGFSDYISVRTSLLYGKLSGDDSKSNIAWQQQRNLNFSSPILELSVLGEFHFFGDNRLDNDMPFSPFVAVGASGFYFNPSTIYQGQSVDLQPLGTEGQGMPGFEDKYSTLSGALLFGAGVKIKLSDGITMVVDGLARRTFTDYIDDLSGNYVSFPELAAGNGDLAARLGNRIGEFLGQEEPVIRETGTQRGGKFVNDYFFTGMVTFYINLNQSGTSLFKGGNKVDCPTF